MTKVEHGELQAAKGTNRSGSDAAANLRAWPPAELSRLCVCCASTYASLLLAADNMIPVTTQLHPHVVELTMSTVHGPMPLTAVNRCSSSASDTPAAKADITVASHTIQACTGTHIFLLLLLLLLLQLH